MNKLDAKEEILDFILTEILHVDSENLFEYKFIDMSKKDFFAIAQVKYFGEEYKPKANMILFNRYGAFVVTRTSIKEVEFSNSTKNKYSNMINSYLNKDVPEEKSC